MHQAPSDPLEPPKFRHKKVPRGPGSPPVPVMHSPPRSVDAKEQADWKIPPSISNWKNPKGYDPAGQEARRRRTRAAGGADQR